MKTLVTVILAFFCMIGIAIAVMPSRGAHEFRYNDEVRVVKGFYQDCTGFVTAEILDGVAYMVDLTCQDKHVGHKMLEATQLAPKNQFHTMESQPCPTPQTTP